MPKQKLIDDMKAKRDKFARECQITSDPARMYRIEGELHILDYYIKKLEAGTFDLTPPVQPTLQKGDKVRHKDKAYQPNGIGVVKDISKSGKQAYVEWTNWDKDHFKWGGPWPAYYRLDKLEVITDEQR